ncbi:MAG: clostripain family protease [Alistipes sp.]|nr:clostripain family protease [Alistipes sp.]
MITRRFWGLLLASALFFTACGKDEIPKPSGPVKHTMLLYMPGRSLLYPYYERNIEGIEKAVGTGAVRNGRILVCYQPDSYDHATLLEIGYDTKQRKAIRKELKIYETFHAENTTSVQELFADVQQLAPAESYGLTIGCHGAGWIPAGTPLVGSYRLKQPMPGALVTRATRNFGDAGHQLDISQLADAVAGLPYRFDYLIFDGCFMANIETLYDLRHAFDYVVASPCEIMGAGFPYERTTPHLFTGSNPDLAKVCHAFWYFYDQDWNTVSNNVRSGCISLAVMNELDALAAVVTEIQAGATREYDINTLQYYEGLTKHVFYDLDDYMRAICADENLYARFKEQLNRAFPEASRLHTPSFYSVYDTRMTTIKSYSGVTTSEPSQQFTAQHKGTSWYRRTHGVE